MRRLKPDPVPDELIWKLLDAAVKAPSGGNRQPWNFIVIRDAETKAKIAGWYLDGWNTAYGPFRQAAMAVPAIAKTYASADRLANHLAEVPVLIMVTLDPARVAPVTPPGANVFPAVQNLLLPPPALPRRGRHFRGEGGSGGGALGMIAVVRRDRPPRTEVRGSTKPKPPTSVGGSPPNQKWGGAGARARAGGP